MSEGAKVQVPWSEIDTLLLDMDGTLLDLAFDNFFWLELVPGEFAKANGLSPDVARDEILARTGAVAGTVSFIGFTPEIFFGPITGRILDANPGAAGHQNYFLFLVGVAVLGLIVVTWLLALQRRLNSESPTEG